MVKAFSKAVLYIGLVSLPFFASAENASLYLRPASGTYTVGSTFEVGIYINTGGQNANVIKVDLQFPPDKLQIVSPNLGKSIVAFWVIQPTFSNSNGTISFQGGVPSPGINTTDGYISSIIFRVVNIGSAAVSIKDTSRVLLADGKGTDILGSRSDAIFSLKLPTPAGPVVVSPKHEDPNKWYQENDVQFLWEMPKGATSVSYVLNTDALAMPDDISEGNKTSIIYKGLPPNTHYFHIKAYNADSGWGGTTHYSVNLDNEPPADFKIQISPSETTSARRPTIIFDTTDRVSGLSHFGIKIIKLTGTPEGTESQASGSTPFFVEATNPFVAPELDFGSYDVVVRAYDVAGNFREVHQRLKIAYSVFQNLGTQGISLRGNFVLSWWAVYMLFGFLGLLLLYILHFAYRRHREVEAKLSLGVLNLLEHSVSERLNVLRQKRGEYDNDKYKILKEQREKYFKDHMDKPQ
ncbi:MAG: cohesin domain-containing protein [bacterium]|nr:cohesin domain-containing protein [bacterium]